MTQITSVEPNVDLLDDGDRQVYLVGTAHVSRTSADLVERVIREQQPDTVCLELCESRYEALTNPESWRNTDIFQVIRGGKAYVLMAQLALASFQRRIAEEMGIRPGEEILRGDQVAKEAGANVALVDREVRITLKRAWAGAGFWSVLKIISGLIGSMFGNEKISEEEVEKLKESDQLALMVEEFSGTLPGVKTALIDERDAYLAGRIRGAGGKKVVAVVGAGHVAGIKKLYDESIDLKALDQLPPPRKTLRWIAWGIPLLVFMLVAYGFMSSGRETGEQMIMAWILANGVFASLGTIVALAHPLTVVTAFVAAPLTSLNPTIAAGWVCGLMEAWLRKPRVADLERLGQDAGSVGGIWRNRVTRVLLVVILANIGSSIGTFVGVGWAVSLLGGN